jgi:hypothetical protein
MTAPPTISDVQRIAAMDDPVLRNQQITHCYHQLSNALTLRFGRVANWCTFAVWASRQAGVTIRGEDLRNKIEAEINRHRDLTETIARIVNVVVAKHPLDPDSLDTQIRSHAAMRGALQRASEAVAVGNLKVFAEIGHEFARFLAEFPDAASCTPGNIATFVQQLRPGDTVDGQQHLREAFTQYCHALNTSDDVQRAQAMLLANLLVGYHEQRRLQDQIRGALDCARPDLEEMRKRILKAVLPGWWRRIRHYVMKLIGLKPPLDVLLDDLVNQISRIIREVATEEMMELRLPDRTLRLGSDLREDYPPALQHPAYQPLVDFMRIADQHGTFEHGLQDWSDFTYRMHYISHLFRSFQEDEKLLQPPFAEGQIPVPAGT